MEKLRKIIHIDMDCFFAAVEEKLDPCLKGKPLAVGGKSKRSVVAAANYEARKYGVHSAQPMTRALNLCKNLEVVFPKFEEYKKESSEIRSIFKRYTEIIEPLSLDEAFLDVSDSSLHGGSATLIAKEIRDIIFEERKLCASAGIGPNKFLAKIASDWNKPNGQFTVTPAMAFEFTSLLPVGKIFGVGKITEAKLNKMGIFLCKDLHRFSKYELEKQFGSWGSRLHELARGVDQREVKPNRKRKSISVENTYQDDLRTLDELTPALSKLYQELQKRIDRNSISLSSIKGAKVKIKYFDFNQKTSEQNIKYADLSEKTFMKLFISCWKKDPRPLRLLGLGVRLESTDREDSSQLEFF